MLQAQPKYNSSELYVSVIVLVQATDTPISLIFPAHLPGLSSPPSDFNGNATSPEKPPSLPIGIVLPSVHTDIFSTT